jgi:hypothetical protein
MKVENIAKNKTGAKKMKDDPCWKNYEMIGTKKKNRKTVPNCVKKEWISFSEWLVLREAKEPYNNFDPKKNHPEGGLKPSYAKKLGIHAGIETKKEAERKGGVKNMSEKTQARRKSFCARMEGMKKKLTSEKTANDPNSKINASLRVWKC